MQIGDENVHRVRMLMDEIFDERNFVSQISFAKTSGYSTNFLTGVCGLYPVVRKIPAINKIPATLQQKRSGRERCHEIQSYSVFRL